MKGRVISALAVGLVAVFLLPLAVRGVDRGGSMWDEEKARFTEGALRARIEAAESEAIRLVSSGNELAGHPQGAFYAMQYLGTIRSVKAVPALCEQLLYEQQVIRYREIVDDKLRYPAVSTLTKIGRPAVEGLLKKVSDSETSVKYRQVAMDLIAEVVGVQGVLGTIAHYEVTAKVKENTAQQKRLTLLRKEFTARYQEDLGEGAH
jgi:HEAT repeat protein